MTGQFIRFALVGLVAAGVDMGCTWLLIRAGLPPISARVPALAAAIVTSWLLNRRHTFRVGRAKSAGEFARFATIALTGAAINFALYGALVLLGMPPVLAIAVATLAVMLFSFFSYKRVAFR